MKIIDYYTLKPEMKVAIVLEYLEGGDLRKYLTEKGLLDEVECKSIFTQIYNAMSYCHKESVIHRDLKLENIMFTDL